MKYAFVAAALVASAVATPLVKRDYVTDVEVVVLTDYVTATADNAAPTPAFQHHDHPYSAPQEAQTSVVAVSYTPSPVQATSAAVTQAAQAASSSTVASAASDAAYPGPSPTSGQYSDVALWHHNVHRHNHTVPQMVWDSDLEASAKVLADRCIYKHDTTVNGGGYGQNMACGNDATDIGKVISDQFYNGEILAFGDQYGVANPDMTNFELWGHFTQIVWKDSTKVGCATTKCGSVSGVGSDVPPYLTFCNYGGPGNYGGQYGNNVLKPQGAATVAGAPSS